LAAAKVGGIAFNNSHPVDFLSDNLAIALNVIRASYAAGVKKLLFVGSPLGLSQIGVATDR
jgi:GDP-L-fucose synthase